VLAWAQDNAIVWHFIPRIIGLDIHRAFAEAVAWDEGELN
jgi:hypothetical protein